MQLEQPKTEPGQRDDHSRHAQSMAGASDEEEESGDDNGRTEGIGLDRADEMAAKDILDARGAAAQRTRNSGQGSKRARKTRVPGHERDERPCPEQRDGSAARIRQIELHQLALPAFRRDEPFEEHLVALAANRAANLRTEPARELARKLPPSAVVELVAPR